VIAYFATALSYISVYDFGHRCCSGTLFESCLTGGPGVGDDDPEVDGLLSAQFFIVPTLLDLISTTQNVFFLLLTLKVNNLERLAQFSLIFVMYVPFLRISYMGHKRSLRD
jgi:hypothetical protein